MRSFLNILDILIYEALRCYEVFFLLMSAVVMGSSRDNLFDGSFGTATSPSAELNWRQMCRVSTNAEYKLNLSRWSRDTSPINEQIVVDF